MGPPAPRDPPPLRSAAGGSGGPPGYDAYCRHQAMKLLTLLPDGAVRPLYRQAHQWSGRRGRVDDPMALLLDYCRSILPLPPFEVWLDDRHAHPAAHMDEAPPPTTASAWEEPVTVEVRSFQSGEVRWSAALGVRPDGDVWRGHIRFRVLQGADPGVGEPAAAPPCHATGEIFREPDAGSVVARFLDFDEPTLQAFLRSTLP